MGDVISFFLFQPPAVPTPLPRSKYFWIETKLNSIIPAFHITHPEASRTILYSHGNAEDLGMIYDYLKDVSRVLKVNIFSYDYTGYGLSMEKDPEKREMGNSPSPSEENVYADIDAAYDHLTRVIGVTPDKIILYGRSLGGGPSCYLAAKTNRENNCVGGLVLHSAFSSVFRVVMNLGCTPTGDLFSNVDQIRDVGCLVYIMHGTIDEVVPFSHGKELYDAIPEDLKTVPFWAEGMGHNNIEADMPHAFIKRLHKFLKVLEKKDKEKKLQNRRNEDIQSYQYSQQQQMIDYQYENHYQSQEYEEKVPDTSTFMSRNIDFMNDEKQKLADIESKIKDIKLSFWKIVKERPGMNKRVGEAYKNDLAEKTLVGSTSWSSSDSNSDDIANGGDRFTPKYYDETCSEAAMRVRSLESNPMRIESSASRETHSEYAKRIRSRMSTPSKRRSAPFTDNSTTRDLDDQVGYTRQSSYQNVLHEKKYSTSPVKRSMTTESYSNYAEDRDEIPIRNTVSSVLLRECEYRHPSPMRSPHSQEANWRYPLNQKFL